MPAASATVHGKARAVLVFWFAVALALSASGAAGRLPPPAPQLVVVALTVTLIVLERRVAWLRQAVAETSLPLLVGLHLSRFVGVAFLVMAARGALPESFAVPAGWGDIAVAGLALWLVIFARGRSLQSGGWHTALVAWNTLGLLDLLAVVGNAARFAFADPVSMSAMLRLPMSLLPFFAVPILLASHVWIYRRLLVRGAGA